MQLNKNDIFDGRYKLVRRLGRGASAEVWEALDTKANNLQVAIKIFLDQSGLSTQGYQDFEREFTTVFNIKHTNLLTPSAYDLCDGNPYLVMQFCQKGSASSLAGKANEQEVLRLMRDVAAGLEYLHDHNIVHQDIKPDNILIDDNRTFMVTDFGISATADSFSNGRSDMSGGTRAYMGPERVDGEVTEACDIWALGATAVEMLTGQPPYGDHGGLLQVNGEPLPDLPSNLMPETKQLIYGCLEANPSKRLTANEVRQKIETYLETGRWTRPSAKKLIVIVATSIASVLICAAIWLWDYNRTRIEYYGDYAEYYGVPKGVGKLSTRQAKHRAGTYRMEYQKGKLRSVAYVNSAGKVIPYTDTEHQLSRYPETVYFYTDDGKIDYKAVYNEHGKLLFKIDYDNGLKTATFRLGDEYNTELNLPNDFNASFQQPGSWRVERSPISRYLLKYDDRGLLSEVRYAALQNVPVPDKNRIYGVRYEYTPDGLIAQAQYLGIDGEPTADSNGLSIKRYGYDDKNQWISLTYLTQEETAAHDGNDCPLIAIEYDEYGNRSKEAYFSLDGEPMMRSDMLAAGILYEYDDRGNLSRQVRLGPDGEPIFAKEGYASATYEYDDNGFATRISYFDDKGEPANYTANNSQYHSLEVERGETGLVLSYVALDLNGDPVEDADGVARQVNTFDEVGNCLRVAYFDAKGNPAYNTGAYYHAKVMKYDENNNLVGETYLDAEGNPATSDGNVAEVTVEYNRQGAPTRVSFLDSKGNPVLSSERVASLALEYDEFGNQRSEIYFDTNGASCNTSTGYARADYAYDPKTNLPISEKYTAANGALVREVHSKSDDKGRMVQTYTITPGNSNPIVTNYAYDDNNRIARQWYTDLAGSRINGENGYHEERKTHDNRGNLVEVTYWTATGAPATDNYGAHRMVQEFDEFNREVHALNYDANGRPVAGHNAEIRMAYDRYGNVEEVTYGDGNGHLALGPNGYAKATCAYNNRGQAVSNAFFGVDGKPILCAGGYASSAMEYDNHGHVAKESYFGADGRCFRTNTYKYNDKGQVTEMAVTDGNGRLDDKPMGYARHTITYDANGVVPQTLTGYFADGTVAGVAKWNRNTNQWEIESYTPQQQPAPAQQPAQPSKPQQQQQTSRPQQQQASSSSQGRANSSAWESKVKAYNNSCPKQAGYFAGSRALVMSATASGNTVIFVVKMAEMSMYECDDFTGRFSAKIKSLKQDLRKELGLPGNVTIRIKFKDKQNRDITSA